ncbi:hypothetical protein EW146_g2225 [Bondarzewia mesenterica]|uniref:Major facilitator superfamily (MFS) profile domain-containing protein n=1 Tax=Bondarzewia mesenterica TaxID=1095465 RepID=A0A4S4M179_9AGAM|nr:hypothetical protein EW146_g2225 [Bondarzewia mesenterica]
MSVEDEAQTDTAAPTVIDDEQGERKMSDHHEAQVDTFRVEGANCNDEGVWIVDWDGPDDPENPKNWTYKKKWMAVLIVSCFTFISPISSSMIAPASQQVAAEFGITNTVEIAMTTSVFVLAYAFGPLLLGPLSELFGRSRVIQLANLFFFAFNLACGFAQNKGQLIAFRFLAGWGGSAPLSVGGGVIGDTFDAENRGQALAIYTLAPMLGPVVGPVVGAWIAEKSNWRWVFYSTTIADAVVQLAAFAPVLLERKLKRIRQSMDVEKAALVQMRTVYQTADRHWKSIVAKALFRPFSLFIYEPIVQLLGLYMAFVYGQLYLAITTLPGIFENIYHENVGIAGLNYIALGIGLSGTSQLNARMLDRIYIYLKEKKGGAGRPEYRLPSMVPATILLPVGLLIAGWSAQTHSHWIGTDIGILLIGAGSILNFQSIQTYVIDAFTLHAASALAAVSFLRALAGFGFPLFAPAMYSALGYGKGNTILAAAGIVIGCPATALADSQCIIILTGAGLSAASGIPTYRGPDGLWLKHDVQELASLDAWKTNPSRLWQFYHRRRETSLNAKPNPAHHAIASLFVPSTLAKVAPSSSPTSPPLLITQNVDSLSLRAIESFSPEIKASAEGRILEMHGSLFATRCTSCQHTQRSYHTPLTSALSKESLGTEESGYRDIPLEQLPRCGGEEWKGENRYGRCGGLLRPAVIWFGEVPEHLGEIARRLNWCDLLIVVGTSSLAPCIESKASARRTHRSRFFWKCLRKTRTYKARASNRSTDMGSLESVFDNTRAQSLMDEAQEIITQAQYFSHHIPHFKDDLVSSVRDPCDEAISTVVQLGDLVRDLALDPAAGRSSQRTAIASARSMASLAHSQFEAIHHLARSALERTKDTTTEVTYLTSKAETCGRQVREMVDVLRVEVQRNEEQIESSRQTIGAAQNDIRRAEETRAQAEGNLVGLNTVAVVRKVQPLPSCHHYT